MRIAFLCGSLEPGRDGVGDYTGKLAQEMCARGHDSAIIALHDRHIPKIVRTDETLENGRRLIVRFPVAMPWEDRVRIARESLAELDADWVSLQFVAYGFNEKGIVWGTTQPLKAIAGERPLHLMFHELWIGGYRSAPWRERLIGAVQRACIVRMTRSLSPAVVTTSNRAFQGMLKRAGTVSELLPLFGNIPITPQSDRGWIDAELRRLGVEQRNSGEDRWLFAFFGTLHPTWPAEPLFSYVQEAARLAGKEVVIAGIGRLGPGEKLWEHLSSQYADAFRFAHFGEQSVSRISAFLQVADFGIAASPWELVGKSGSVASMLEHGLPVIVNRDDVKFPNLESDAAPGSGLLVKMDQDLPQKLPMHRGTKSNPFIFIFSPRKGAAHSHLRP